MMNQYETVFIVTPVLSEFQMKEAVDKFREVLLENEVEIVHEDNWGLRKLAYPIQNRATGYYYMIQFKAEGSFIETLETQYRRDERIIRFLTFKLDKYSLAYSEKRRNLKKKAAEKKEEAAEVKKDVKKAEKEK